MATSVNSSLVQDISSQFFPSLIYRKPLSRATDSPDTLPSIGYTKEQLTNYIIRQLGSPAWNVELTNQQIYDAIQDALMMYSLYKPQERIASIQLSAVITEYMIGVDVGQGITKCEFVDNVPAPMELFYGNLISPAPLMTRGIDDYDTWLRWRKTWKRITSVEPQWIYDEYRMTLFIHNPIERYRCTVYALFNYERTEELPQFGANWVKKYSLERSKYLLGEVFSKYNNAIPGPLKDIQLDGNKKNEAKAELEKFENELKGAQDCPAIMID